MHSSDKLDRRDAIATATNKNVFGGRVLLDFVPRLRRLEARGLTPSNEKKDWGNGMTQRGLAAEFVGTFMLMASVLGAFYAFAAPSGAAGILGVALSIGFTVMALAFAIGHVSGGHFNPAVTLGLIAGGRVAANTAVGYIIAQCGGAIAACAVFWAIGRAPPNFAATGYDALSMTKAGMLPVFVIETVLTAFLVFVIMGATNRRAAAGFAPIALGTTLTAIHIMALPISNASVNPARSLGSAIFAGTTALGQVWLFWVAPILGAVIGGVLARWLQEE
jgi:aquaporin Z